jgi:hypothetical protein
MSEKNENPTPTELSPEEIARRRAIIDEVTATARDVVMMLMSGGFHPFAIVDICAVAAATSAAAASVTREQFIKLCEGSYDSAQRRMDRAKESMPPEIRRVIDGTATAEDIEKVRQQILAEEGLGSEPASASAETDPASTN